GDEAVGGDVRAMKMEPTEICGFSLHRRSSDLVARDHDAVHGREDVGVAEVHLRLLEAGLRLRDAGLVEGEPRRRRLVGGRGGVRWEEHTSELQSLAYLVCRRPREERTSRREPA